MINIRQAICILLVCGTTTGCGLGYNRMLFVTRTNFGLDVDTTPPTAEISVARREGLIAPAFDGDETPEVLGTFKSEGNTLNPALTEVFAGGRAASLLTLANAPTATGSSTPAPTATPKPRCVTDPPRSRMLDFFSRIPVLGALTESNDNARPFFFGTDTTTGLKVAWSGTAGNVPDSVKFGYNRKNFALAPVFGAPTNSVTPGGSGTPTPTRCPVGKSEVKAPSFLAMLFNGATVTNIWATQLRYVQTFATGRAAENLAQRREAREFLTNQIFTTPTPAPTTPPSPTTSPTP